MAKGCISGETGSALKSMAAAFAASLLVHVAFFLVYFGGNLRAGGDTPLYLELSRGFFSGGGMNYGGSPSATYPPVYPAMLAALASGGEPGGLLAAVQLAMSASVAASVYMVARVSFGSRAGRNAAFIALVAPQFPFWAGYALSDSPSLALGMWGLVAVQVARRTAASSAGRRCKPALLAGIGGLSISLCVLARPLNLSAFPVTTLALVLLGAPLHRSEFSSASRGARPWGALGLAAIFLIGFTLLIGVWAYRNERALGSPVLLSTRTGWQLWQGVLWDLEGRGTVGKDVYYPEEASGLSEVEADRYLVRKSLEEIRAAPGRYASKVATRAVFLWLPTAPGLGPGMLLAGTYFCIVAILATLSLRSSGRWRASLPFWLGAVGVTGAVALTILDPEYRYRLPLLALLIAPAGAGFEVLEAKARELYSRGVPLGGRHGR